MSRWFRFYTAAMRDPDICRLSDRQYRINLNAALSGEKNEFSRFLSGPFTRPDKPCNRSKAAKNLEDWVR